MHRSGTSALTRVLSLCGAKLPKHLMGKSALNPRGFFESEPVYHLHEELLSDAGSAWDDLAPMSGEWLRSGTAANYVSRMADVVRDEFGDSPFFVLKDPRMCRLVPFWERVFEEVGVAPSYVLAVRNPLEVAASLERAQGVETYRGQLVWLTHFLLAERDSRGSKRTFVSYDGLLNDWRATIREISADLDLAFPRLSRSAAAETDQFLSRSLRHHEFEPARVIDREDVAGWIRDAYAWALRAVDGKEKPRELDAILDAYLAAENAFGPVLAESEQARRTQLQATESLAQDLEAERAAFDERLQGQLQVVEQDVARADQRIAVYQHQVNELVECIKVMLAWIASSVGGAQGAAEQLDALLGALDSSDADSIPAMAVSGLSQYRQSVEAARLQRLLAERDQRIADLEELAERRSAELTSLRQSLTSQETQLEARVATQQTQIEELSGALDTKDRELASRERELRSREAELAERDAELASRDQEVAARRHEISTRAAELAERDVQIARLQADVREHLAEIERLRPTAAELVDAHRRIVDLQSETTSLREVAGRIPELERAVVTERERAAKLQSLADESRELQRRLAERDDQLVRFEAAREELAELHRRLANRDADLERFATMSQELAVSQAELGDRNEQIAALRASLEEAARASEAEAIAAAELRITVARLETERANARRRVTELEAQIADSRGALEELDRQRDRIERLVERVEDRERRISELELERRRHQEEIERLSAEMNAAYGEVQRLHGMLSQLQN